MAPLPRVVRTRYGSHRSRSARYGLRMDSSPAADELYDLLAAAEPVALANADVYIEPKAYLAIVARMRADARSITDEERGKAETPVSALLDELERLGEQSKRTRRKARYRISRRVVMPVLMEFVGTFPLAYWQARRAELERRTHHVALDGPDAPTLQALLDRVEHDGQRFLISRGGELLADLSRPDSDL